MFWQIYDTLSNNILNVVFRCVLRFIGHGQFAVFQVACLAVNLNQIQFWRPGKATCFLRRCWRNEIFKCGGIIDDVLADRAAANFREIYKLLQPGDMGNLHSIVNLPSSPNPWGTRLIPMWEIPIVAQSSFPHVFFKSCGGQISISLVNVHDLWRGSVCNRFAKRPQSVV